ncbi:MAG: myo-inositol 2-dehydrogenase / D-chiro-inositol 1-dehydrogenase [Verrucomicrobia bacterium]|nr:MAG: myo-inositol 2-dehydrogenase / D-chiro-inositol 1-dehydrogenase [Verrucomicrobiota bacterium]
MPPIRFALAGFGAWGKFHAQSIAGNRDAKLVAITAPSEASREEAWKLYPEAQIFADSLDMIAKVDFDIIDIATPSHTHREIALAGMERGKHVLLEKPMAITLDDCKAIVAGARDHGVHLAVGHELRLSSQWGRIKEIIVAGTIGDPQYVLVELSRKPYRPGASGWRYDQSRVGSWVLEEPIHFFDLARWYLEGSGDPVELYAYGNSRDSQRPSLYDNFSAMFQYSNGSYAVVSQTLAAFEHHQTVKVSGTKGALWAGWSGALDRTLEPTAFLKVFDGEKLEEVTLTKQSGEVFELREEIAQSIEMVRSGKTPIATGLDGLWSAGLCLVAEESIRQKRPLPVGELLQF